MADIIYVYEGKPYFNITNKCPCNCVFCIRNQKELIGEAKNMWHDVQPDFSSVKNAIDSFSWENYTEAVFCGYGEPTNELDLLLRSAEYLKKTHKNITVRLNTNGLSDLINKKKTAKLIAEVFDAVSISLNETSSEEYDKITRNNFEGRAFDAMLEFTKDCVRYMSNVRMTVVDVISKEKQEKAREICQSTGAEFFVRSFVKSN